MQNNRKINYNEIYDQEYTVLIFNFMESKDEHILLLQLILHLHESSHDSTLSWSNWNALHNDSVAWEYEYVVKQGKHL